MEVFVSDLDRVSVLVFLLLMVPSLVVPWHVRGSQDPVMRLTNYLVRTTMVEGAILALAWASASIVLLHARIWISCLSALWVPAAWWTRAVIWYWGFGGYVRAQRRESGEGSRR